MIRWLLTQIWRYRARRRWVCVGVEHAETQITDKGEPVWKDYHSYILEMNDLGERRCIIETTSCFGERAAKKHPWHSYVIIPWVHGEDLIEGKRRLAAKQQAEKQKASQ